MVTVGGLDLEYPEPPDLTVIEATELAGRVAVVGDVASPICEKKTETMLPHGLPLAPVGLTVAITVAPLIGRLVGTTPPGQAARGSQRLSSMGEAVVDNHC
jgi:hypothetical protein